jgi:hypothetical protein
MGVFYFLYREQTPSVNGVDAVSGFEFRVSSYPKPGTRDSRRFSLLVLLPIRSGCIRRCISSHRHAHDAAEDHQRQCGQEGVPDRVGK